MARAISNVVVIKNLIFSGSLLIISETTFGTMKPMLHASGIIAVVIAGLIHGFERDRLIRAQTELQMNH
jgi:NhaP-type Na+/H+ or K+/H+ antiporter